MKNIMEKPKPVPFYDLCRLCLENEGLTKICSKEGLARDVYLCTGVVVRICFIYNHTTLYSSAL